VPSILQTAVNTPSNQFKYNIWYLLPIEKKYIIYISN
jgi:hypothetical protein